MRTRPRPILLLALLGAAAAVPAFAQSQAPSASPSVYPTCKDTPSKADTEAAHGAYMAGKGSFDEADYTTALNYFKDAYRRDCTKHELLIIIARAYELQGNKAEAVHALETYLERVPNAQDAPVQKKRIENLKREMAAAIAAAASATPSASASAAPSAAPSASASVSAPPPPPTASAPPPPPPPREHTVWPWVTAGAGAALAITGGALLAIGSGQVSTAEQACPTHSTCNDPSARSTGNGGRTLETVGVVMGSVGVAAIAGGLIWHFAEPTGPSETSGSTKPAVLPQVGPGYAGAAVGGRF